MTLPPCLIDVARAVVVAQRVVTHGDLTVVAVVTLSTAARVAAFGVGAVPPILTRGLVQVTLIHLISTVGSWKPKILNRTFF